MTLILTHGHMPECTPLGGHRLLDLLAAFASKAETPTSFLRLVPACSAISTLKLCERGLGCKMLAQILFRRLAVAKEGLLDSIDAQGVGAICAVLVDNVVAAKQNATVFDQLWPRVLNCLCARLRQLPPTSLTLDAATSAIALLGRRLHRDEATLAHLSRSLVAAVTTFSASDGAAFRCAQHELETLAVLWEGLAMVGWKDPLLDGPLSACTAAALRRLATCGAAAAGGRGCLAFEVLVCANQGDEGIVGAVCRLAWAMAMLQVVSDPSLLQKEISASQQAARSRGVEGAAMPPPAQSPHNEEPRRAAAAGGGLKRACERHTERVRPCLGQDTQAGREIHAGQASVPLLGPLHPRSGQGTQAGQDTQAGQTKVQATDAGQDTEAGQDKSQDTEAGQDKAQDAQAATHWDAADGTSSAAPVPAAAAAADTLAMVLALASSLQHLQRHGVLVSPSDGRPSVRPELLAWLYVWAATSPLPYTSAQLHCDQAIDGSAAAWSSGLGASAEERTALLLRAATEKGRPERAECLLGRPLARASLMAFRRWGGGAARARATELLGPGPVGTGPLDHCPLPSHC